MNETESKDERFYTIFEYYPEADLMGNTRTGRKPILMFQSREAAEEVLAVIEKHNILQSTYIIQRGVF